VSSSGIVTTPILFELARKRCAIDDGPVLGRQAFAEAAVGVTQAQFVERARRAQIQSGETLAAGLVGQRARHEGFAAAGGCVNQKIVRAADPVAGSQAGELGAVEPAASAEVELFQSSALFELSQLQLSVHLNRVRFSP
jgi:hypothetical protein